MIQSVDDAWRWYTAVKTLALDMRKLAGKWNDPALETVLGRDNRIRERTAADLTTYAGTDVERQKVAVRHPAVLRALKDLGDAIESGSFGKITEAYKDMDVDLTSEVNQVRQFRNDLSHGRPDKVKNLVNPETAIDRLRRYLDRLAEVETDAGREPGRDA